MIIGVFLSRFLVFWVLEGSLLGVFGLLRFGIVFFLGVFLGEFFLEFCKVSVEGGGRFFILFLALFRGYLIWFLVVFCSFWMFRIWVGGSVWVFLVFCLYRSFFC